MAAPVARLAPGSFRGPALQEPLRELLGRLAGETADLARSADQLQVLFGQLMADPPKPPDDAVERAQTLDALVQRLEGMHAFLAELSSGALQDLPAEAAHAAANLRLTTQGRRLSAQASLLAPPPTDPGDCQLF